MAQQRQSGTTCFYDDQVSVGIRSSSSSLAVKQSRIGGHRNHRFRTRRITVRFFLAVAVTLISLVSLSAFFLFSNNNNNEDKDEYSGEGDEFGTDLDFLANVTRTERSKILKFGHGMVGHGRDSRYWDKDDRRRDEDYGEDEVSDEGGSVNNLSIRSMVDDGEKKAVGENKRRLGHRAGLYNEAGRNELKRYEAEYEASLKGVPVLKKEGKSLNRLHDEDDDADDEYGDEIDMHDIRLEDYNAGLGNDHHTDVGVSQGVNGGGASGQDDTSVPVDETTHDTSVDGLDSDKFKTNARHVSVIDEQSSRRAISERRIASKKRLKRRACEMKIHNSTVTLVEPPENRKFAKFSLQYTELEENINNLEPWKPQFAGHQSLEQREQSFVANDQTLNCGFVKSPKGYPSTGFDLAEEDEAYIGSCHIAVISCIFGNSDRLRSPMGKTKLRAFLVCLLEDKIPTVVIKDDVPLTSEFSVLVCSMPCHKFRAGLVSRFSRKNVCFVMFVDAITLQTLSSEGHMPDRMGYIGIWRIVVVKNLPYTDMRRVGKIPKLLAHRLFQNARYSIWLDSKLRLQLDPLLVLEYFLWRKGHEYAISNHYDRHCVWEEVAQNKKLNKYNHTIIDEQFAFYQADGLTRFNPMDPQKLLPSNVPEGSFIVRAHTPMSNLFSCLWFNEVERFTPRDQLSFAYTYQKLRRMNPSKPFYFSMFKDCERRKIAKLFRHRSEETRYTVGKETVGQETE
ncbi:transmembrane protein [Tanacetum coccineum]